MDLYIQATYLLSCKIVDINQTDGGNELIWSEKSPLAVPEAAHTGVVETLHIFINPELNM